jgi:5'-AMP-activated protein kinase catalytic alpha subunit
MWKQVGAGTDGTVRDSVVKVVKSVDAAEREYRLMRAATCAYVPRVWLVDAMLVMPKADADLLTLIQRARRALAPGVARAFIRSMVYAVFTLHTRGIVHRDVKLENFLVYDLAVRDGKVAGGTIMLSDFGFATRFERGELLDARLGTPTYVAPEILAGRAYGPEADVFSLAVCAFTVVTGRKPFGSHYRAVLPEARAAWRRALPTLADKTRRLIAGGMQIDPARRLSSVECARLT